MTFWPQTTLKFLPPRVDDASCFHLRGHFITTAHFWLNLQVEYDLEALKREKGIEVKKQGEDGKLKAKLNRRSAARFFLDIIENKKYIREVIGVSNAR